MAKQSYKGELSRSLNEKEIEWKISRFISLSEKSDGIFESPEFYFMGSQYQLVIRNDDDENDEDYSDNGSDDDDDFHWLLLRKNDNKSLSRRIKVTFTFMWSILERSIDTNYKIEKSFDWDLSSSLKLFEFKRSKLLDHASTNKEQWILTVQCRLESCDLKKILEKEMAADMTFGDLNRLSGDMEKLFTDGVDSDVTLRVQGKDFQAHRSILASRSDVLAAIIRNQKFESNTSVLSITDCEPDAFGIFLKYLYSGYTGELTVRKALDLMKIAVKYSMVELRSFCVEFLRLHLATDTVCKVASAAHAFGEVELLSTVQAFFNVNNAEIFCSESWENLMREDCLLANKLLKGMALANPIELIEVEEK